MHPMDAMRIFVRVAELGSFTQAADERGLPKATVSDAVRQLESELGTQLLHRTTRRVRLTPDGERCLEHSRDLLADFDETRELFRRGGPSLRGRLRVDMSSGIARYLVVPALPAFLRAHPDLLLELSSTDRRVDPVREGFDCVVRVGRTGDSRLVARPLGAFEVLNCASPAYLHARGTPHSPDDLAGHTLIHYVQHFGAEPEGWESPDGAGGWRSMPMPGALVVNNAEAYVAACVAGLGLIQSPITGLRALIAEGALVEVMPQHRAEPMPVTLLYPQRRNLPHRVAVFMDWLEATLRPHLIDWPPRPQTGLR
jgi:DNA-binding transcriptional LysR family regulator